MRDWQRAARDWRRLSTRGRVGAAVAIIVLGGALASADRSGPSPQVVATASPAPTTETATGTDARTDGPTPTPSETASPAPTASTEAPPSPAAPSSAPPVADHPRGDDALVLREGRVVGVVDGDTLDLDDGTRVRLAIVDTPEVHGGVEPCGPEASAFTREFVLGRDVAILRPSAAPVTDSFGRLLGEVIRAEDATSLNVALAAAGLGDVDERFTSEDRDLADRARAAAATAPAPACTGTAAPPPAAPQDDEPPAAASPTGSHTGRTDGGWSCHAAYRECLPAGLGDLDCAEVGHQVALLGESDPWRLDGNSTTRQDGLGCASYPPWAASSSYPYE